MKKVAIIMGSDSDLPVMKDAADILEKLGIEFEIAIMSAHRTPERTSDFAKSAKANGFCVIIAGAGGAAHLAGVVAALTPLPVIGVPIKTPALGGVDSLYSTVQMPGGIPVATMAINGALNAGLMAARIIGVSDGAVSQKLSEYRQSLEATVLAKAARIGELGYKTFGQQ